MTEIMDLIKSRRSIRNYLDKKIPEPLLKEILEAVRWSPSWANTQVWELILVQDAVKKQQLFETLASNNPAGKAMIQAPVIFALCAKLKSAGYYKGQAATKLGDWFMFDLGIATQSLCLSAYAIGLGTVVVGLFDQNKAGEILGVAEGYELVALIPMGYPAKDASAPKRRELEEFVHYDSF
ncbi:MAG: nitroreductase [Desulfobacteraceae bacterium]|nr:MAG: nitroreductase [Desulfobacteraceae bacterium]